MSLPRRSSLVVLLCLALAAAPLLAGCLDSGSPAPAPATEEKKETAGGTDANPSTGSPAGGAPQGTTQAPKPKPVERHAMDVPVAYDASTQGGACVRGPNVSECRYPLAGSPISPLRGEGDPVRLAANLTWTAPTPATQTLHASLAVKRDDGWIVFDYPGWSFTGKSPLAVDWDLRGAPAGITWGIAVTTLDPFSGLPDVPGAPVPVPSPPASGSADVPQQFHVAGVLTVLAPAAS